MPLRFLFASCFFSVCVFHLIRVFFHFIFFICFLFLLHFFAIAINRCSSALSLWLFSCVALFLYSIIRAFWFSLLCRLLYAILCNGLVWFGLVARSLLLFRVLFLIPFVLISYSITFVKFSSSFSSPLGGNSFTRFIRNYYPLLLSLAMLSCWLACVKCVLFDLHLCDAFKKKAFLCSAPMMRMCMVFCLPFNNYTNISTLAIWNRREK